MDFEEYKIPKISNKLFLGVCDKMYTIIHFYIGTLVHNDSIYRYISDKHNERPARTKFPTDTSHIVHDLNGLE